MFDFRKSSATESRPWACVVATALCAHACVAAQACTIEVSAVLIVPTNCRHSIGSSQFYTDVIVQDKGQLDLLAGAVLSIRDTLIIDSGGTFRFNDQTDSAINQPRLRATLFLLVIGNITTVSGADQGGIIDASASGNHVHLVRGSISSQFGPVLIACPFENDGIVTANGIADGFDIIFTGQIRNGSTGTFEVTHANSEMIFNHDVSSGSPSLSGDADFNVEAGLMHFQKSLATAGGFRQTGGRVRVSAGRFFSATGQY